MKTRFYDHIDLRVRDMKVARRFYREVLPALGFTEKGDDGEWFSYYAPGEGKPPFFGLTEDPDHRANGTRISFWAETREEVDRVADVVKRAGGKVLEGPELCIDYTPDYYAFFWEDPDGNKLEICCRTRP
ncbi:MAG TPA: VOC family protein [Chthoniobacterales bacterium]